MTNNIPKDIHFNPVEAARMLGIEATAEQIYRLSDMICMHDRAQHHLWRVDVIKGELERTKAEQGKLRVRVSNLVGVVGRHQKELFGGNGRIDKELKKESNEL
jgi:hypothetical protein